MASVGYKPPQTILEYADKNDDIKEGVIENVFITIARYDKSIIYELIDGTRINGEIFREITKED